MQISGARETRKRVLILDSENSRYALIIARSIGTAGHKVDLGFQYGSRILKATSKYCNRYLFYPNPSYSQDYFEKFFKVLAGRYDFILPLKENTQIAMCKIKECLEEKGTTIPIPEFESLHMATDKARMIALARRNQIALPLTIIANEEPFFEEVVKEIGLPFIMKASSEMGIPPGPGSRYSVIRKKNMREHFSLIFKKMVKFGPVIFQQYIQGVGIGASFIFSRNQELIAVFGHRRILECYPEGGPSVIAETFFHRGAIAQGLRLLSDLKWKGVAMTEFKLGADGEIYFMEVNPRFWGTLPLAIASGVNFPKLLIDYFNVSEVRQNSDMLYKRKILFNCMLFPLALKQSFKMSSPEFLTEILKSTSAIFRYGFRFATELEKFDIAPELYKTLNFLRTCLVKKKICRIGDLLFGSKIEYDNLKRFGIRSVIDLREATEMKTYLNSKSQIEYINFPIEDNSTIEISSLLSLISLVDQAVKKGPTYVHCNLGKGRAPMVVATYLVSKGYPVIDAFNTIYRLRPIANLTASQKATVFNLYKYYENGDEKYAGFSSTELGKKHSKLI